VTETFALIVAAGRGERAGGGLPKQFRRIAGKSLLAHAFDGFAGHSEIAGILIVAPPGADAMLAAALDGRTPHAVVPGCATRRASVAAGLAALAGSGAGRVLIHDAARPFIPAAVIDRLVAALETAAGAVPVLPVVDTLARAETLLGGVVDRTGLVRVQTPQAFRFADIHAAHRHWRGPDEPTDDAQVARAAGIDVAVVAGDAMLEKVTLAADFDALAARRGRARSSRTGLGYDVHRLGPGDGVWLGGIRIPHDRALVGHSDADVALHALTDAVLGAIAAGDIGTHFPPSDPQWRGADSARFLEHAAGMVAAAGGRIEHVDLTIICEAPKIGPQRAAMRARIAGLLRLPEARVSIKATTTEGLGFAGRSEGIAAQAVATVSVAEDEF
jgi:2-C-methyl-D-erythritol 4-phosphate cytidylyltransferase/2-C-methyl-D-erythritol 2,4-cyclodiphosphate synthase